MSHRDLAEDMAPAVLRPGADSARRMSPRSPSAPIIFLIVLIVVHLITSRISDAILDSRVGMIDRILGFLSVWCAGSFWSSSRTCSRVFFVCKDGATRALSQGLPARRTASLGRRCQSLGMISHTSGTLYGMPRATCPRRLSGEQQQGLSDRKSFSHELRRRTPWQAS